MSIFDEDSKMYRFPSFHETPTCDQAKTAQESLRSILAKFPVGSAQASASPSLSSSSSSTSSSPPPPPAPLLSTQPKRASNASDYKWISTCPRSSGSSASSKSSSSSSTKRKSSLDSHGGRKSPSSRSSIDPRHRG